MLEVGAAQARHLHVGDQARRALYEVGIQEFFGGRKSGGVIAERSHKSLGCLSHRFIVVYDRNQESSAQVSAPWSFLFQTT
jgi:hypothetical protein